MTKYTPVNEVEKILINTDLIGIYEDSLIGVT